MGQPAVREQCGGVLGIAGLRRPVQSVPEVAGALEVGRRPPHQDRHRAPILSLYVVAENLGEQLVVTEARLGGVQRDDERVRASQSGEHVGAAVQAGDRLGQRPGHLGRKLVWASIRRIGSG